MRLRWLAWRMLAKPVRFQPPPSVSSRLRLTAYPGTVFTAFRPGTPPARAARGGSRSAGALDQAVVVGEDYGRGPVAQPQLGEHVVDVGLDRALADEQVGRDLAV